MLWWKPGGERQREKGGVGQWLAQQGGEEEWAGVGAWGCKANMLWGERSAQV